MSIIRLLLLLLPAPLMAAPSFQQCYDFGCKSKQEVQYSEAQWQKIGALFDGVSDSASEKQAIRSAIASMEKISGDISGTHLDRGGNYPGEDIPGQMDCIDESSNSFQYLSALQQSGLLKWHRVEDRKLRIVWFISHWTAVISELQGGRLFAVDSWHRDNGELPIIQPLEDWSRKRKFPVEYNPELASG